MKNYDKSDFVGQCHIKLRSIRNIQNVGKAMSVALSKYEWNPSKMKKLWDLKFKNISDNVGQGHIKVKPKSKSSNMPVMS